MASPPDSPRFRNVNDYEKRRRAWKFEGYPEFSKWQASDHDFWIFRRFGSLSSRLVLWRQDRIVRLESELKEIDEGLMYRMNSLDVGQNDSFRVDAQAHAMSGPLPSPEERYRRRDEIMEDLWREMECYYTYINQCSSVQSRPQAGKLQIESNKRWLRYNHPNAIEQEEQEFITKEKDLISMVQTSQSPLENVLRNMEWLQFLFREKRVAGYHVQSACTNYFDDRKFQTAANVLTVGICMAILIGTMVALNYLISKTVWKEITIGTAAAVMAVFLAWATDKKAFEVVTSMAIVTAVWMVYLQIRTTKADS